MQIATAHKSIEFGGTMESNDFTIDSESIAKLMQILTTNIYKDKISACIREPVCNAWDANPNKPFLVHLPSRFEPFFSVRDYGPGLSYDDVMKLYTSYGKSLKDKSQDMIGGFGIGSKAPFAYNESFNVTSWHKGADGKTTKSVYFCIYVPGADKPKITHASSAVSDEPTGLEVHVPVRSEDSYTFIDRAKPILARFDPAPVVKGYSGFEAKLPDVVMEDTKARWRIRTAGRATAVMGNVAYPIDIHVLGKDNEKVNSVVGVPVEIDFKLGEILPAPSREDIDYQPWVVDALVKRIEEVHDSLADHFSSKFIGCKTAWEAAAKLHEVASTIKDMNLRNWFQTSAQWNGKKVETKWDITIPNNSPWTFGWVQAYDLNYSKPRVRSYSKTTSFRAGDKIAVYLDDGKIGPYSRLWHEHKPSPTNIIVITVDDRKKLDRKKIKNWKAQIKKFEAMFPGLPVKLIGDLPKAPASKAYRSTISLKVCDGSAWFSDTSKELDASSKEFYVDMFEGSPVKHSTYDLSTYMDTAKKFGLIPQDTVVYGIPKSAQGRFNRAVADGAQMTEFFGYIKPLLVTLTQAKTQFLSDYADYVAYTGLFTYADQGIKMVVDYLSDNKDKLKKGSVAASVVAQFAFRPAFDEKDKDKAESLKKVWRYLGVKDPVPTASAALPSVVGTRSVLTKAYPLLRGLIGRTDLPHTEDLPHILEYVVLKS